MVDVVLMADPRVVAVPVEDDGSLLVDVRPGVAVDDSRADPQGWFAHVRAGVRDRLVQAAEDLPGGLRLVLVEGYRPAALQERYYAEYLGQLSAAYPDWPADRLRAAASRYVSPPEIAPHSAGAAVDVTLHGPDGELDLGSPVNAGPEGSGGRCFTASPDVTGDARALRDVLGAALRAAGFANYPTEWWHWSYGDRYWALEAGAACALHGPVGPPHLL